MTDRPILFSAPMVRALLDGRKTQTRRVAKFVQPDGDGWHIRSSGGGMLGADDDDVRAHAADYAPYAVGDRLWVKETWTIGGVFTDCVETRYRAHERASHTEFVEQVPIARVGNLPKARWPKYASPLHMPRWASRITLTVTDVRVERLQDISNDDALAEGIIEYEPTEEEPAEFSHTDGGDVWNNPRSAYQALWDSINGNGAWDANPWVAAISFDVHARNIDAMPEVRS